MKIDKVSKELDQVFDKLLCLFDSDEIKQSLKKKHILPVAVSTVWQTIRR
jgi:hypothetical protein